MRRKSIDELTLKRLKKETRFGTIVIGDGVTEYVHIKCTKCSLIFANFDKHFSIELEEIVPACPNCKVDFYNSVFLPLDKNNNIIS